jgi:hypothetical protein
MARAAVLQASTSFTATVDGTLIAVRKGDLIEGDHPLVEKHPDYFEPVTIHHLKHRVEQATAAPGEKRGI